MELHEKCLGNLENLPAEGSASFTNGNYLYGFQIGSEGGLWEHGRLRVAGFLKAGVYGNHITYDLQVRATDGQEEITRQLLFAKRRPAFIGEIGLLTKYQFTPHLAAYAGYQVMWLEGIGLAVDFALADAQQNTQPLWEGMAFYHGGIAGLELRW